MRRLLLTGVFLFAGVAAAILYVAVVGITIDASGLRGRIAELMTQNIGRQVDFDGPLQLELSAHPSLRVGGLRIDNPAGFPEGHLVSLGEARLALELWPLLENKLRITELSGSAVTFHLLQDEAGKNNWTLQPPGRAEESTPAALQGGVPLGQLLTQLDIQRIALQQVDVVYRGRNGRSHFFELESLEARFPEGQPIHLHLNGRIEKQFPYRLELQGGTLAALADGSRPWPIDLRLAFMSSRLFVQGEVAAHSGKLSFGLGTENLAEFERLLQISLPPVGLASIAGDIEYGPGEYVLRNLVGVMGQTQLTGDLALSTRADRPQITGVLELPVLDLRPFMTGRPSREEPETPPQSLAQLYRDLAQARFDLQVLRQADLHLELRVGKWLDLPGDIQGAELVLDLEQGRLNMPLRASVTGVAMAGALRVDASRKDARFHLHLGTGPSSLGGLAQVFFGLPAVRGSLEGLHLAIDAHGNTGSQLMHSLVLQFALDQGRLNYGGDAGRPVDFTLDRFTLTLSASRPLQGSIRGSLLEVPVQADLRGGKLGALLQGAQVPVDLLLRAGSARAGIHAQLAVLAEDAGSEVGFFLNAPHSGEVANWFGLQPTSDARLDLRGRAQILRDTITIPELTIQIGQTAMRLSAERSILDGKPFLRLDWDAEVIDVAQLESLLPQSAATPAEPLPAAAPTSAAILEIPVLPQGIDLAEADIRVHIERILGRSPLTVGDVEFTGNLRDGRMHASPFAARVGGILFTGAIALDLRTAEPHAELWLAADRLDVGRLLHTLGLVGNLEMRADAFRVHLDAHASRLGELLAKSSLLIALDGGLLEIKDANTGGVLPIRLDNGEIRAGPGMPIHLQLQGGIDQVPMTLRIATATAAELLDPRKPVSLDLDAHIPGLDLQLQGKLTRPMEQAKVELALEVKGTRFDRLDPLLHASLPPWGPWLATGKLQITRQGYEVSNLLLQVGSSRLQGVGKLDTLATPPRLEMDLLSSLIQLDDFEMGSWSPEKKPAPPPAGKPTSQAEMRRKAAAATDEAQHLLSPEVLRRQNAYLRVRAERVLSGADVLGSGALDAKVEEGRIDVGPVVVNIPGGSAQLWLAYAPSEQDVAVSLRTQVDRFDYSILARRQDSSSRLGGRFSLNLDVSGRANHLSEVMRNGNGHLDVAVWPQDMKAGLLDLWAVNVLVALLPAVDDSKASRINCAIGQFTLSDGQLKERNILIDTSRMRVSATATADFKRERFHLYARPRAKTPQFMSIALPVEVAGSFNEFSVGVRGSDALETAARFVGSIFLVPWQMLFGKDLPADGRDVCAALD